MNDAGMCGLPVFLVLQEPRKMKACPRHGTRVSWCDTKNDAQLQCQCSNTCLHHTSHTRSMDGLMNLTASAPNFSFCLFALQQQLGQHHAECCRLGRHNCRSSKSHAFAFQLLQDVSGQSKEWKEKDELVSLQVFQDNQKVALDF
jgi:hypothetical protein